MTECDGVREILPAYLEGIALPAEAARVASHLATCQACSLEVRALMKSQKLIHSLPEVEPPTWLKTRIMARLEEGAEEEKEGAWGLSRLRDLFVYPLRIKIPLQALSVLLVAVAVFYVYRTIQPEMKPAQQPPQAVATIPLDKHGSPSPAVGGLNRVDREKKAVPGEWPQEQRETGTQDVGKPAPGTSALPGSPSQQPAAPPALKMTEGMREEMRRAVLGSEPQKAKAAKAYVPGDERALSAPPEDRARGESKAEAAKGTTAPVLAAPQTAATVTKPEALAVTIKVKDVAAGSKEVEAVLRDLGAAATRESREGSNVISAEVSRQKAKEIVRRLASVGQLQHLGQLSETAPDRPVSIRIQVFQKQP